MCRALQSLYFATVSTPHFKIDSPVPLSNVARSGQGCFRLAGRVTGDTRLITDNPSVSLADYSYGSELISRKI